VTRVLIVATTTGYQIRSFSAAAEKIGADLVFASDRCDQLDDPWWDQAIPIRFHDEPASIEAVVAACRSRPLGGVVAVGDRPAVLAASVAARLGLPGHPVEAARASRDKLRTRMALRAAGLPTPAFRAVRIDEEAVSLAGSVEYPVVVKPLALSGSRGVMRADSDAELATRLDRLRRLLRSPDVLAEHDEAHQRALVEAFVPGREYAVEGVLTGGVFRGLAVFEKPDPLDGPFFEETIYVTPPRAPAGFEDRIYAAVADAARALGLRHGPVHAECRVNPRGVYVLEAAARPIGGLCSKALRFDEPGGGAASLEEVLLRHAVGEPIDAYRRESASSGVMMIPIPRRGVYRRVEGLGVAREVNRVEDVQVTAKPDSLLVPLPEGRSYLGFIFARAGSPDDVERALRDAHRRLRFVIDREVAVARPASSG
jgi:hypothetical protein